MVRIGKDSEFCKPFKVKRPVALVFLQLHVFRDRCYYVGNLMLYLLFFWLEVISDVVSMRHTLEAIKYFLKLRLVWMEGFEIRSSRLLF